MAVGKIGSNLPIVKDVVPKKEQDEATKNTSQAPKKDYTKTVALVMGGLAVAGLAGVLIYRATRGKSTSGTSQDIQQTLGDFAKKFGDEGAFVGFLEKAKTNENLHVQVSPDRKTWCLLADLGQVEGFGCQFCRFEKNATGQLTSLDFCAPNLTMKVNNYEKDLTQMSFDLDNGISFGFNVNSKTGQILADTEQKGEPVYDILISKMQKIVDDCSLQKLIDDADYRKSFVEATHKASRDAQVEGFYQDLARRTGRNVDDVRTICNSPEFKGFFSVKGVLSDIQKTFNLGETSLKSGVFSEIENINAVEFIKGETEIIPTSNYVEDAFGIIPKQICYNLRHKIAGAPTELVRVSEDGRYVLYERGCGNFDNTEDFLRILNYNSPEYRVQEIVTKNGSFRLEGDDYNMSELLSIKLPQFEEPLEFRYNLSGDWKAGNELGVEAEEYMPYMEKLAQIMRNSKDRNDFIRNFPTKSKEILENLLEETVVAG